MIYAPLPPEVSANLLQDRPCKDGGAVRPARSHKHITEELKPCPAGHVETILYTNSYPYGSCTKCGWTGPMATTESGAAESWNTRAESAEVERLRAQVVRLTMENKDCCQSAYEMGINAGKDQNAALRARIAELELYVDTLTNSTGAAITEAVARGQQREARIAELEDACAALESEACTHPDGLGMDWRGNPRCRREDE